MSGFFVGALLGLGLVLVASVIFRPKVAMADAIAPYVGATSKIKASLTSRTLEFLNETLTSRQLSPWASDKNISTWFNYIKNVFNTYKRII